METAFADYQNTFPKLSTNTIMYGHTYNETTIFSKLKYVLQDKWLKTEENHIITLDTEEERLKFQVFSIYTIETTNDYLYISFSSKEKYQNYLNKIHLQLIYHYFPSITHPLNLGTDSFCVKNVSK